MSHNQERIDRDCRPPSQSNGDWISDLLNDLDCLALHPVGRETPGRIDELARGGLVRVPGSSDEQQRHGRFG